MPTYERPGVSIHYEEHGEGFPLLLFAPGGMRSSIELWQRAPYHPVHELASSFRVIAMDQRNAGQSRAALSDADGWNRYTDDHLGLLDHLGIATCHVLGGCIGSSFALALMAREPERVHAAVLQQPIGKSPDNGGVFEELFDGWARDLALRLGPLDAALLAGYRQRMFGGEFVYSVAREQVRALSQPLLVLMGDDVYHPSAVSREIAALAPRGELVERWKEASLVAVTVDRVRSFLLRNVPDRG